MTDSPAAANGVPDPIAATRRWVERAVIGLNLCPFAKAVYVKQQVRFVLSDASTPEALLEELAEELILLRDADPEQVDTTLIVHPDVLIDFLDYNDFLDNAAAAARRSIWPRIFRSDSAVSVPWPSRLSTMIFSCAVATMPSPWVISSS